MPRDPQAHFCGRTTQLSSRRAANHDRCPRPRWEARVSWRSAAATGSASYARAAIKARTSAANSAGTAMYSTSGAVDEPLLPDVAGGP